MLENWTENTTKDNRGLNRGKVTQKTKLPIKTTRVWAEINGWRRESICSYCIALSRSQWIQLQVWLAELLLSSNKLLAQFASCRITISVYRNNFNCRLVVVSLCTIIYTALKICDKTILNQEHRVVYHIAVYSSMFKVVWRLSLYLILTSFKSKPLMVYCGHKTQTTEHIFWHTMLFVYFDSWILNRTEYTTYRVIESGKFLFTILVEISFFLYYFAIILCTKHLVN